MTSSLSWRITEPLRQLNLRLNRFKLALLHPDAGSVKSLLLNSARFLVRHCRLTGLKHRMRGQNLHPAHVAQPSLLQRQYGPDSLPPSVYKVYQDIQRLKRGNA
jgi:hypothetical protein